MIEYFDDKGFVSRGKRASEACCICGGGAHISLVPSTDPSSLPSSMPSSSPSESMSPSLIPSMVPAIGLEIDYRDKETLVSC